MWAGAGLLHSAIQVRVCCDVACLHLFCFARFKYFDGAHQCRCGLLAQLVEHRIPDPKAGGSSPP